MIELVLLTLAIVASIGPTNLYSIKEGSKYGASHTFFVLLGAIVVDAFYASLAGLGLGILGENLLFKGVLLTLGTIIFLKLGISGLITARNYTKLEAARPKKKYHPFISGILLTLPNPFTILFWTTAISGLTITYEPLLFTVVILVVGIVRSMFEAGIVYCYKRLINDKTIMWVEVITSVVLLFFAMKFIYKLINLLM